MSSPFSHSVSVSYQSAFAILSMACQSHDSLVGFASTAICCLTDNLLLGYPCDSSRLFVRYRSRCSGETTFRHSHALLFTTMAENSRLIHHTLSYAEHGGYSPVAPQKLRLMRTVPQIPDALKQLEHANNAAQSLTTQGAASGPLVCGPTLRYTCGC
jgi:hypothetical protein